MSHQSKLCQRHACRELRRENEALRREVDEMTDTIVPVTLDRDGRAGETISVRVPRRYKVKVMR